MQSIDALQDMTSLAELDLSKTKVKQLRFLKKCTRMAKLLPVAKPATLSWCYGSVPRMGEAKRLQPRVRLRLQSGATGKQEDGLDVAREPGPMTKRDQPSRYTWLRVTPSRAYDITIIIVRMLLLMCGDVERNPGPTLIGAQWNVGGLTLAKRIPLERQLKKDNLEWCVLFETHFLPEDCASFSLNGYLHYGIARDGTNGGGVSILVRDDISWIPGPSKLSPAMEMVTLTLVLPDNSQTRVVALYFPSGNVHDESLKIITETVNTQTDDEDVSKIITQHEQQSANVSIINNDNEEENTTTNNNKSKNQKRKHNNSQSYKENKNNKSNCNKQSENTNKRNRSTTNAKHKQSIPQKKKKTEHNLNQSIENDKNQKEKKCKKTDQKETKIAVVIQTDANCHHEMWQKSCNKANASGTRLAEWILQHNFECCNDGSHTWRRYKAEEPSTTPDIAFIRDCVKRNWESRFTNEADSVVL
ncbi:hypothetical protein STCU_02786 [Strigomonas culicis]|uniref:Endonuclease/exonuclease/phosphatase domain-containing protein n=1 Tax=Strigomonas culicis TaxID=28005 RepID=S9UP58_9TRYP|nr:hypothetical protein STCU_02786 [Strigomonas culicis]|eukprot:EPY32652.1 hypothetical protein STCU_02786 [Strigomonas culicis]